MPEEEPSILRQAPLASEQAASNELASDDVASDDAASDEPAGDESASDEAEADETESDGAETDETESDKAETDEAEDDEPETGESDETETDQPAADSDKSAQDRPAAAQAATYSSRAQAPVFYVAGFWRRLAAAIVDLAIILPVALLLSWLAGAITGVHLPPSRHRGIDFWLDLLLANDPALIGILGLTLAVATAYALIFQIVVTRTPGMRIMKIRIIDQYGDLLTTGRAAARTAGYLAATATLGLGFIWMGFDSEKRGLHDWLSGTYVVKA